MENNDIPDGNILASSQIDVETRMAKNGRLNGATFWAAGNTGQFRPWIQANIGTF